MMFAVHSTAASEHPPRILAIETSGSVCAVALVHGTHLLAEYTLDEPGIHDRMLAVLVERLLSDVGNPPLDALAVSAGPGSFTGLRIGIAFAKGFCFARDVAFLAVPTLEACAAAAVPIARQIHECDIAAIAAAHDELFFVQHYSAGGDWLTPAELLPRTAIERRISQTTILCGPGASAFGHGIHIPGLERLAARFVARRAVELFAAGVQHDPATATPLYVEEFAPRIQTAAPESLSSQLEN
jgi:tRNA threonylcarbamoyl adenosine modification protein YeaZ